MPPALEVIIPTYNNQSVLPLTLSALFAQILPAGTSARLILCDDGSTDRTPSLKINLPPAWELTRLPGAHRGAATARNRGLRHTAADLILFLGADILLQPGSLAAHLDFHRRHPAPPAAALGAITWDPRLLPNPLMEWLLHGGPQNNFDALLNEAPADPRHFFYGAHLSLKRAFLFGHYFDESFGPYGWEDLELGRRLAPLGLVIYPLFTARGVHRHLYHVVDVARRQRLAGQALVRYQTKYPSQKLLPSRRGLKHLFWAVFIVSAGPIVVRQLVRLCLRLNLSFPRLFQLFATLELWSGILKGVKLIPKKT